MNNGQYGGHPPFGGPPGGQQQPFGPPPGAQQWAPGQQPFGHPPGQPPAGIPPGQQWAPQQGPQQWGPQPQAWTPPQQQQPQQQAFDNPFQSLNDADPTIGGGHPFFDDGLYRCRIDSLKLIKSRKGKLLYVIQCLILESTNPEAPPGSMRSSMIDMSNADMRDRNMKHWIAAVLNSDPRLEVHKGPVAPDGRPWDQHAAASISDAQPWKGWDVGLYAHTKEKRNSEGDFTAMDWMPADMASAKIRELPQQAPRPQPQGAPAYGAQPSGYGAPQQQPQGAPPSYGAPPQGALGPQYAPQGPQYAQQPQQGAQQAPQYAPQGMPPAVWQQGPAPSPAPQPGPQQGWPNWNTQA